MKKTYIPSPKANANANHISLVSDIKNLLISRKNSAANKVAFRYRVTRDQIRDVTYSEFAEEVAALGDFLVDQGFQNKHIAIIGYNSYQWVVAFFAITATGNVAIPLDNALVGDEILDYLEQSDSEAVFCSKEHFVKVNPLLKDTNITAFNLEEIDQLKVEGGSLLALDSNISIDPSKPAAIFFTSGTSGNSKGVILTHGNMASNINGNREKYVARGATLSVLPFHHAYGLVVAILFVFNEEHLIYINSNLKFLIDDFQKANPTAMAIVPLYLDHFKKRINDGVRKQNATKKFAFGIKLSGFLRKLGIDIRRKLFKDVHKQFGGELAELICGGAPIDHEVIKFFDNIGVTVINGYGLTETSPVVSTEKIFDRRQGSCGTLLNCNTVRIAEDGEIFIKGENVFKGYYNDEELTKEVLIDGEFATGDLGHMDEDGFLYITGRKKNLIILSNGENISPEEIELILGRDPGVAEIIVAEKDNRIVAYVFPNEEYLNDKNHFEKLRITYNATANQYKRVAEIILRDEEFIKNTNRKILRHKNIP